MLAPLVMAPKEDDDEDDDDEDDDDDDADAKNTGSSEATKKQKRGSRTSDEVKEAPIAFVKPYMMLTVLLKVLPSSSLFAACVFFNYTSWIVSQRLFLFPCFFNSTNSDRDDSCRRPCHRSCRLCLFFVK
jgi:hypothetical protein